MECNTQNLSLLKLNLLAGSLAKTNVLFNQYLQFEANFKTKCCSRGRTIMLANEKIGLLLFGFVVLHCHFWAPLTKYRPCSTSKTWQQQLISSRAGQKLAQQLPFVTPWLARGELTASSCSCGELLPRTPFQTLQAHMFCPWKSLTSSKTIKLRNLNCFLVAWNSTVLKFGQHFPLLHE